VAGRQPFCRDWGLKGEEAPLTLINLALRSFAAALLLAALSAPAHAQIGVYGEFSAQNFSQPNTGWQYGTTFGIYDDHWHVPFFALGIDGRGSIVGSGDTKTESGYGGPRLVFNPPIFPLKPYVEALVGAGHAEFGQGLARTSSTEFAYQFLGGVDWTIFPRVDWRVAEFSYGSFKDIGLDPKSLSTGIVVRLP
jgi:hypothetical protein